MTGSVRFDRGTLELGPAAADLPGALWDQRSSSRRVAAYRFADLVAAAEAGPRPLPRDLRAAWSLRPRDTTPLCLRPYQQQALASWTAFGRRGLIVLPTGSGKT